MAERGLVVRVLVAVVLVAAAVPGWCGEGSVGFGVDLVNQYVWRGVVFDDGWSLQPNLALAYDFDDSHGVELDAWWNVACENHGSSTHDDEVFEQDLTFSYWRQVSDTVSLSAGSVYYWLPFSDVEPGSEKWHNLEAFLGGSWSAEPFTFEPTLSYDLDRVKGWYLDLAGSLSLPLSASVALEPGLHLGLASGEGPNPGDPDQEYWYLEDGLVDGEAVVGLTYTSPRGLFLGGGVHYVRRFDGVDEDEDVFWFGLKLGYSP